ncbi:MAG: glycosyl hydrolase family 28-related protein [Opitutaceae bacterium]
MLAVPVSLAETRKSDDRPVLSDWSHAGNKEAHHPPAERIFPVDSFGAIANDGRDDSIALQAAIEAAKKSGGGVVYLPEGMYYLDQPVLVTGDQITIRGDGPSRTRLVFRYGKLTDGLHFVYPEAGGTIGPGTWIEARTDPRGLVRFSLFSDDRLIKSQQAAPLASWQQSFALRLQGGRLPGKRTSGSVMLRATAEYEDGTLLEASLPAVLDETMESPPIFPQMVGIGAITFLGARPHGQQTALSHDGKRGDRELTLSTAAHGFRTGSKIELVAPNTERWFREIGCKGPEKPDYRRYHLLVTGTAGERLEIDQPLRLDFPVVDGSFVRRLDPLENAAIESLELEVRSEIPSLNGVVFLNVWACRARDVRVLNAGRHQMLFSGAKWCRLEDCFFRDRRSKGGGTDYVGFQDAYDCLMDNVIAMDMRHGPVVQYSAAGNVIRNSRFFGSDAQWHAGWSNENLFENCLIVSRPETGSYGYGMYATPPDDPGHGPNGPRNVIFHCDVHSPKAGVWLGGMNDGWLFLYNRFVVEDGPGMLVAGPASGHKIIGNVFVLANPGSAGVEFTGAGHTGHSVINNRFYMADAVQVLGGEVSDTVSKFNSTSPYPEAAWPALPEPAVPSLYHWQVDHDGR